jgi:DNA-binding CsgD family transcriptional regulator
MNIDETLEEPVLRRWLLLSKTLESMPLNEALRVAQSAEYFLSGGSDFGPTGTLDALHQSIATQPLPAPAAVSTPLAGANELRGNDRPSDASANLSEPRNSVAATGPLRLSSNGALRKEGRQALTPRENDILMHIVRGESNKVIAHHLHITEATVKVHIRSIMKKIPATNRTQVAIWAMNNVEAASQSSQ